MDRFELRGKFSRLPLHSGHIPPRAIKKKNDAEIPANCAACPLVSRPISNIFMASAMRASFSNRSEPEPDNAAQDSGYSI
jgi:hypothetical protein